VYVYYAEAAYHSKETKASNQIKIKSNLFCHKFSTQYNDEFAFRLAGQTGDNFALVCP